MSNSKSIMRRNANDAELKNIFDGNIPGGRGMYCDDMPLMGCESCMGMLKKAVASGSVEITAEKMARIQDPDLKQLVVKAICLKQIRGA